MTTIAHHASVKLRIDNKLDAYFQSYSTPASSLKQAMQYSVFNGGKRMRPWLIDIVGQMLGAHQGDSDTAAMAIEVLHAYSLVHDDLPAMDDDDTRRGLPTNHIKFGEATAILAGDALQTMAFEILANSPLSLHGERKRVSLLRTLANASGLNGMCAGQSIDLLSTGQQISLDELQQLHQLKTGALLQACVKMAAQLSPDVSEQEIESLSHYARIVGLAFQVQDDILDVTSDSQTLGKPQGSDFDQDKNTFVSHLGLSGAQQFLLELEQQALQALATLPYNTQPLIEFTQYLVKRDH